MRIRLVAGSSPEQRRPCKLFQNTGGRMRRAAVVASIFVAAAGLWFFFQRHSVHRQTLHAYFRHVQNVKKGMPVCVDGVQVGTVVDVVVRPELGDRPVEVSLALGTPYELRIPGDSTAQVVEPGILRQTVVDVDTRGAHGLAVRDGGSIQGRESTDDQAAHALGVVVKALADQSQESQAQGGSAGTAAKPKK
jgi:ABC-type transporter Mla subunit MlaD